MYARDFLTVTGRVAGALDAGAIEAMVDALVAVRERGGRLFVLGVGGSAANASHAAADFRKLAGMEAYAPADNVTELTARTNDEGWETVFSAYLEESRLTARDAVLVFSVGGGSVEPSVSANLVAALEYARRVGAATFGVVGRDGGHTARVADHCVVIPPLDPEMVTPQTESFQAVVWHLLVTHPKLRRGVMKWESLDRPAEVAPIIVAERR